MSITYQYRLSVSLITITITYQYHLSVSLIRITHQYHLSLSSFLFPCLVEVCFDALGVEMSCPHGDHSMGEKPQRSISAHALYDCALVEQSSPECARAKNVLPDGLLQGHGDGKNGAKPHKRRN